MNIYKKINKGTWKKDLRLYVHVPFCVKKCLYCDFLSGPSNEANIKSYFEALYKEIQSYKNRANDYNISSIFIGGGTPSSVDYQYIVATLEELKDVFNIIDAEISIEVNPGTVDDRKLRAYYCAGINRISFGLQSANVSELKLLGRIHTYGQFVKNYHLARKIGFTNINVDLMSALPSQTLESWEETLQKIIGLSPEHISAYSLIIEEGTPFYDMYGPKGYDRDKLPDEDTDRRIYKRTKEILEAYGYIRYEISNYAKEGYESKHNLAYWEGTEYLGLGLGSSSLLEDIRFHSTYNMDEYIDLINKHNIKTSNTTNKASGNNISSSSSNINKLGINSNNNGLLKDWFGIRKEIVNLTKNDQIEEFMFLGLRKTWGVSKDEFFSRFGISIEEIYNKVLNNLQNDGLIVMDGDWVRLTDYGIDISNHVLAEFLLE